VRTDRNRLPISLWEFPLGSCGDACLLLARFLQEHGFGEATYVHMCAVTWGHTLMHGSNLGSFRLTFTAGQFVRDPEKELWS